MTPCHLHRTLTPRDYAAVVDAAKLRAQVLRQEAIAQAWASFAPWLARALRGERPAGPAKPSSMCRS